MKNFKPNSYIELFNPGRMNYFPVRILEKIDNSYRALNLHNKIEINIYDYQLNKYGFRNIWITEDLLYKLGFVRNDFIFSFENIVIFECIIGDSIYNENPFYLFEFNSKFLGYAIIDNNKKDEFINDYRKIDFNSIDYSIMKKYYFTSLINDVFSHLMEYDNKVKN